MRRAWTLIAAAALVLPMTNAVAVPQDPAAETAAQSPFTFQEVMIPMRDGAKLQTVILTPKGRTDKLPILLQRTPYGVPSKAPPASAAARFGPLLKDGYVFVFQSMRGRFKSDGTFTFSMALGKNNPAGVDEATDAYDTIDWLVKHVPHNNGKVGMWGISYPGFAAAVSLAHPHPALKAVSPQADWVDYWMNDDLHRYGAMRLSYATDWLYMLQHRKDDDATFQYDDVDTYNWFLREGNAANIDRDYFKGSIPMFTAMIEHPNYDSYWQSQRWTDTLTKTTVPTLMVAGFWDQEDPWGPWQTYDKQEENDPDHLNVIVAGPWNHGGWAGKGDMMGTIPIGQETGTEFQDDIQAPFFRYWLHGEGPRPDFAAKMFEAGSNTWQTYAKWPPAGATATNLYLRADGSLSFEAPAAGEGCRDYISDPANPVPFRPRPISPTYPIPDWRLWEFGDQRFVDHRPDVLSYQSAPLTHDLRIVGKVAATLFAATTGTDSDMVVKLIDVYPQDDQPKPADDTPLGDYAKTLDGYELPVAMEIRRGRFLQSNETPHALTPGKVTQWTVPLRDRDYVFKKGHRIMVQVQSSWFPMIDRNPQTFVPNIAKAPPEAYVKATQTVCSRPQEASRISLPVMP